MSLGPLDLPGPDQALGGRPSFSVAHYVTDFGVWADWFAPALRDAFGLVWPLALALAVIGAVLAITRGPTRMVRMLGAVAILTALVYVVTPVTASGPEGEPIGFGPNLRYLTPGLALALALLPVALMGFSARVRIGAAVASGLAALPLVFDLDRWHEGVPAAGAVAALLASMILAACPRRRRDHARRRAGDPLSGGRGRVRGGRARRACPRRRLLRAALLLRPPLPGERLPGQPGPRGRLRLGLRYLRRPDRHNTLASSRSTATSSPTTSSTSASSSRKEASSRPPTARPGAPPSTPASTTTS